MIWIAGASSIGSEFINDQIPLHQREAMTKTTLAELWILDTRNVSSGCALLYMTEGGEDSVTDEELRQGHGPWA